MGKIYGKANLDVVKPKKSKNERNRHRNIIMNFRVSPKEKALIDARIEAAGMSRSTYFIQSCLYQKVLVKGNIRSFSNIKEALRSIAAKIEMDPNITHLDPEDIEKIKIILEMMKHLFGTQNELEES